MSATVNIPVNIPLEMIRGLTFPGLILQCVDPVTGDPVHLAGKTPFAEVRREADDDLILDLTPEVSNVDDTQILIPTKDITETANVLRGFFNWALTIGTDDTNRFGPFAVGTFSISDTIAKGDPPQPA
jgi:hypothetical protein